MPMFNTGNATWDQGLNTLGTSLFPDPSKVAQAGYYGAEARNAMLKGAQTQNQMAHQRWLEQQSANPTGPAPAENYAPAPGPNMPPIMQPPDQSPAVQPASPAPSAAPPAAPPTLGQTVTGGPPQPPAAPPAAAPPGPPAVPPPGGLVGAGMSPASLGSLVAQGGGAVGGGQQQPQVIGQGPNGGAIVQPTMSPGQAADNTPALMAAHPNLTQGTPPATDSPAPNSGAPPTSNATASNGTVPQGGDTVSGIFHPGSVTDSGGGQKQSGPANADGSPAKPQFNLSHYIAMAVGAGMDANQAQLQGSAYLASLYQKGIIDRDTYHQMLGGVGAPQLGVEDLSSKTQLGVAGIQAGSAANVANIQGQTSRDVANITQTGETTRTGMPLQDIVNPDDPTKITRTPLAQLQHPTPSYNPSAVSTAITPQLTQPGGPGTPVISQPTSVAQAQKSPIYQPTVGAEQDKPGTYIDPKNPTQLIPSTFNQAQKLGYVAAPTSMEGWTALAASASANEPDPAKAQAIRDKVMSFAVAAQPKAMTPNESVQNSNIINQRLQGQLPVPTIPLLQGGGMNTNTHPAGASEDLEPVMQNLTDQYYTRSPDPSIRGNRVAAADAAVKQLIKQGYINPNQSRAGSLAPGSISATTINKPVFHKDGTVTADPHFRVDMIDPNTKQPYARGTAPAVQMETPSLSSTVIAKPTGNTGTKIGRAPAGAQPGAAAWVGGQQGVVGNDGFVYAGG